MSKEADVEKLFNLYILLQQVMKEHVCIDDTLKGPKTSQNNEFEKVAFSATSIVQTCEEIENLLAPKQCCSCT